MIDQGTNVLTAFPEWRDFDGDDGDLVIEVLAKLALFGGFFERGGGGGDQAEIGCA